MKKSLVTCVFSLVAILGLAELAYCESMAMAELVDSFYKATDLQRERILKDNLGREISASGKVNNVGEYDFYDMANDIKGIYYQVTAEPQKTKNNVNYQAILLFKDKDKVGDINKGQEIQKDAKIIRILDERLQITVWLFCGELGENDQALMKQTS